MYNEERSGSGMLRCCVEKLLLYLLTYFTYFYLLYLRCLLTFYLVTYLLTYFMRDVTLGFGLERRPDTIPTYI